MHWWRVALLSTLLLSSALAVAPTAHGAAPRFERTACPFKVGKGLVDGKDVLCGFVREPEDHATPGNGRTVRLAVAIFKSLNAHPAPDPLVFLQGGPGGAIVSDYGSQITRQNAAEIVGRRDLILIDQRGTGLSRPNLGCPEVLAATLRTQNQHLDAAQLAGLSVSTAGACRARLIAQGVNLSAYTTIADAADIADLGPALGYPSVDVYGVSYGTRVALTMMRLYPATIRSVILDSNIPPQSNLVYQGVISQAHIIDLLFARCAAQPTCNAAYPHLATTFNALIARLNAAPPEITVTSPTTNKTYKALLTGDVLEQIFFNILYIRQVLPEVPALLAATANGDYSFFAQFYGLFQLVPEVQYGDYFSVECSEDVPFTSRAQIAQAEQRLVPAARLGDRTNTLSLFDICDLWKVPAVATDQKKPVHSVLPALVLAGQFDPVTPPTLSDLTASTLSHAYRFTFPGFSHGIYPYPSAACPLSIVNAFLDHPDEKPVGTCIATMPQLTFTTP